MTVAGLRNTRLIHKNFERWHYATANGQMTAECTITRPSSQAVFDEVAGRSTFPAPADVYEGPCRVGRSGAPAMQRPTVGDRDIPTREFIVSIPVGAALVQINDIVTVTRCDGDPDLAGMVLTVTDSRRGSLTWQRDLVCTLQPPTAR